MKSVTSFNIICEELISVKLKGFCNIKREINNHAKSVKPIKMAYKAYRDGKVNSDVPIVIMHGLFGSKQNWSGLGNPIQKNTGRIVYAVDARNHGDSPHTDEFSYIHLAEDIKLFITDIKATKAALIGHSMGGRAAMVLALLHPLVVESLTVVDISPVDPNDSLNNMQGILESMKAVTFKDGMIFSEARRSAEEQLTKYLNNRPLANFLTMNIQEKPPGKFSWKINVDAISRSYQTELLNFPIKDIKFHGPTLFVVGGDSDFVNLNDVDKIIKIFPQASFEIIESTGHLVHVERPKIFSKIVSDFINNSTVKK